METDLFDVKIIDRTRAQRNKSYEIACAEGLDISIEELRMAVEEAVETQKERIRLEKGGMIVSISDTIRAGRVRLFCDVSRLMEIFGIE